MIKHFLIITESGK